MVSTYEEVTEQLRRAYDGAVEVRSARPLAPWKLAEREAFLGRLVAEGRGSLLEIGAGTSVHGLFFAANGIGVACTDLCAAMVEHCRGQGP